MRKLSALFLLLSSFGVIAPQARSAPESTVAAPVNVTAPSPDWKPVLSNLEERRTVRAPFVEERYSHLRKVPFKLTGVIRISPDHGLSIHYATPRKATLIADTDGILERNGSGRQRSLPHNKRAEFFNQALLGILRFNPAYVAQTFQVSGSRRSQDEWRLRFVPREQEMQKIIEAIVIRGSGNILDAISIDRGRGQHIEISLGKPELNTVFSSTELKKYFR